MNAWLSLSLAIVAEVIATSALKASDGFTHLWPSAIVIAGYAVAFYCLSLTLRQIPLGIAYAVWSGAGTALIALIGVVVYRQKLDPAAVFGIALIVAGVLVLNLFSKSGAHG
jgi:small multidrug resistance pump